VRKGEWVEAQKRAASSLGLEKDRILLFSTTSGSGKKEVWQAIEHMLQENEVRETRKDERRATVCRPSRQRRD
jgi:adenylylsulfate kinase-like enzyme